MLQEQHREQLWKSVIADAQPCGIHERDPATILGRTGLEVSVLGMGGLFVSTAGGRRRADGRNANATGTT